MAAKAPTQRQLDQKIKIADDKIEKYRGYIANLQAEKKTLQAQKRKLAAAAAKKTTAASKTATKKKATTTSKKKTTSISKKTTTKKAAAKKAEPTLLEGILDGVKQAGLDPKDILESLLGGK